MPIFQYKCKDCASVFEHLTSKGNKFDVFCIQCGSKNFEKLTSSGFTKTSGCGGDGYVACLDK